MPASTLSAVIFDLDGTLVDSEVPGLDVLHEEAVKLGVAITRDEAHAEFRGKRMSLCIAAIGNRLAVRPPDFERTFTAHIRHAMAERFRQGLNPMPGALELVARLRRPHCIATNGPREKAELTLGLTGLLSHFQDRLFCAYEVGHFKPDPGLFLHAAKAMDTPPERCAVIEDSLPGIEAGLAAGMQVLALCKPALLPDALTDRVRLIDGLPALDRLLHGGH